MLHEAHDFQACTWERRKQMEQGMVGQTVPGNTRGEKTWENNKANIGNEN